MMQNAKKVCNECDNENRCELGTSNNDDEQEVKEMFDSESDKVIKKNERNKKKVDRMKVKGKLENVKEEGVVRLFCVNCNGFRPYSESKINQIKDMSKLRNIDSLMISSSDVQRNYRNEMKMIYSLKTQTRTFC